ncbi:nucleotide sugar dehydrogenase [Catenovulum agarivorans]|uniref:nucleotide sugar dehydrogenase n=1 Tax=Catenovulum agarivorans TaxID=1172192 RepID=UPI0003156779|nr:nucleotide sugar dehydrogenase [Catenovulum agarivorans]
MNKTPGTLGKLANKQATIGIIGLGYVGLPLAMQFSRVGFKVVGFDIDKTKVEKLSVGECYIQTVSKADILAGLANGFIATSDMSIVSECDAIVLCLPTPLNKYKEPDLKYVTDTLDQIVQYFVPGQVLSFESTTYPGTTDEVIVPRIESAGLIVGENFYVVYSPEREDPGNQKYSTHSIPKVIAGVTEECLQVGLALYKHPIETLVPVTSVKVAEMTKLLENIHRAVNIGLVNEMKIVCDKMGINIFEVIRAAATKPFGFTPYYPGPGIGGHCIPVDPFYLTWKAKEFDIETRFIELSGMVNSGMPAWVVTKITDALNNNKKAVNGSSILVLGVAYKKNVDDTRESPSLKIIELLQNKGAYVDYSDPHVPTMPKLRKYSFDMNSTNLTADVISTYDAVVLVTEHDGFDYEMILSHAQLIVDTRGHFLHRETNNKVVWA